MVQHKLLKSIRYYFSYPSLSVCVCIDFYAIPFLDGMYFLGDGSILNLLSLSFMITRLTTGIYLLLSWGHLHQNGNKGMSHYCLEEKKHHQRYPKNPVMKQKLLSYLIPKQLLTLLMGNLMVAVNFRKWYLTINHVAL